jgi:hypothetical protein
MVLLFLVESCVNIAIFTNDFLLQVSQGKAINSYSSAFVIATAVGYRRSSWIPERTLAMEAAATYRQPPGIETDTQDRVNPSWLANY